MKTLLLLGAACGLVMILGGILLKRNQSDKQTRPFLLLPILFALMLIALLGYQAYWQLWGGFSIPFQRFQRKYDRRSLNLQAKTRGTIYDSQGKVLSKAASDTNPWPRITPLGEASTNLIGYSQKKYGLSALERVFDTVLSGFDAEVEPYTTSAPILTRLRRKPTRAPQDITLTINADYQRLAYQLLAKRKGAVVVLDPHTGAILALASSPSIAPDKISQGIYDKANSPLFNRAIYGLYPPASTFKIFTAAVAIESKLDRPLACDKNGWMPGPYTKPIRDTHPSTKPITLENALIHSSNIYFGRMAKLCGAVRMKESFDRFFPQSRISLARQHQREILTQSTIFPDLIKRPNQVAYCGFGQGDLLMTPIHVAMITASIANGGFVVKPAFAKAQLAPPRRIWQTQTTRRIGAALYQSTRHGTAKAIQLPNLPICAKTGTAQNSSGKDHAWFTCYAPADKPTVVITVLVEQGGYGAATALPIAKQLLKHIFQR